MTISRISEENIECPAVFHLPVEPALFFGEETGVCGVSDSHWCPQFGWSYGLSEGCRKGIAFFSPGCLGEARFAGGSSASGSTAVDPPAVDPVPVDPLPVDAHPPLPTTARSLTQVSIGHGDVLSVAFHGSFSCT